MGQEERAFNWMTCVPACIVPYNIHKYLNDLFTWLSTKFIVLDSIESRCWAESKLVVEFESHSIRHTQSLFLTLGKWIRVCWFLNWILANFPIICITFHWYILRQTRENVSIHELRGQSEYFVLFLISELDTKQNCPTHIEPDYNTIDIYIYLIDILIVNGFKFMNVWISLGWLFRVFFLLIFFFFCSICAMIPCAKRAQSNEAKVSTDRKSLHDRIHWALRWLN